MTNLEQFKHNIANMSFNPFLRTFCVSQHNGKYAPYAPYDIVLHFGHIEGYRTHDFNIEVIRSNGTVDLRQIEGHVWYEIFRAFPKR